MVSNLNPRKEYLSDGIETLFQVVLAVADVDPTKVNVWTEDRISEYPDRVFLVQGTDYDITLDVDKLPFVELFAPIDAGLYLVIQSALPYGQYSNYIEGDPLNPEVLERDFDKVHILGLQSLDDLSKTIRAPYDDPLPSQSFYIPYPEQRKNKYLFFADDGSVSVSRIQGQGMRWGEVTNYAFDELIEDAGILYKCIVAESTIGERPSLTPTEWVYYNSRSSETVSADAIISPPVDEHTVYVDTTLGLVTLSIDDVLSDNTIINIVHTSGEFPILILSTGIQGYFSDSRCIVWDGSLWSVKSDAGNRGILNINSSATIPNGVRNTRIYVDASIEPILVVLDDALNQDDRISFIVIDDTYEVRVQGASLDLSINESSEFTWTGAQWQLVSTSSGSTSILSVDFLIGSFYPFGGPLENIPEGMMPCLGQSLNPLDEPKLFEKIGTTYGGDGITTFFLPDLQGIGVRGVGTQDVHGAIKGSSLNIGEIWEDEFEAHTHDATHDHDASFSGNALSNHSHSFTAAYYRSDANWADGSSSVQCGNTGLTTGGASAGTPSGSVTVDDEALVTESTGGAETHPTDLIVQWLIFTGSVYTGPNPHNFPIGTISMFDANTPAVIDGVNVTSGVASEWIDNETLPGWYACVDGNQSRGCQNLVDRFIMGKVIAGSGVIGGANSINLSIEQLPSHIHSATSASAGSHSHTLSGDGSHNHVGTISDSQVSTANLTNRIACGDHDWGDSYLLNGGTHGHTIANGGDHSHTITVNPTGNGADIDITPAKYSVIFIRKCL